jgi:hypothetical protein
VLNCPWKVQSWQSPSGKQQTANKGVYVDFVETVIYLTSNPIGLASVATIVSSVFSIFKMYVPPLIISGCVAIFAFWNWAEKSFAMGVELVLILGSVAIIISAAAHMFVISKEQQKNSLPVHIEPTSNLGKTLKTFSRIDTLFMVIFFAFMLSEATREYLPYLLGIYIIYAVGSAVFGRRKKV